MGLNLSKCWNVGRGGYLLVFVKILHAKVMKEWFFIYKVEC